MSFVSVVVFVAAVCGAAPPETATNVFENPIPPAAATQIDKLVFPQLARLKIQPVLCSDVVFVRRAYLDVLGTLPTAKEARDFIQNPDPEKRRLLIDSLLERDEFADYWAMKWGDILRIKAEFPINLWPNAAQAYHRWVHASIAENKPYDRFARELLTSSGSNFRVGPVNFYRAIQNRTPEGTARAVALAFMGARAEAWPTNRLAGMATFFSQIGYKPTGEWKEEHVFWDPLGSSAVPGNSAPGQAAIATIGQSSNSVSPALVFTQTNRAPSEGIFPDGTKVTLSTDRDPRQIFADWLITPENPWFTRSIVNRVWAWLLGRGIIHEPDDIRDDNPPSNPALLAYLEKETVAGHYDLKRLYRLILNSRTYQLSSMPRGNTPEAEANFASYPLRRLDAEVLIDAINKVTGSSDLYTSPIPEPFTYIPKGMPAVAIADGSISSPFLALFGRSARATGMENERNNKPTPAQWLYLLNSSDIQRKLEQGPNLQAILNSGRRPSEILEALYLLILSRFPTPDEVKAIEGYGRAQPAKPPERTKSAATNSTATAAASSNTTAGASVQTTNRPANTVATTNLASTNRVMGKSLALGSLGPTSKAPEKGIVAKRRDDWVDIAWSLINSEEFLYRH
jgi:hypothetical protein